MAESKPLEPLWWVNWGYHAPGHRAMRYRNSIRAPSAAEATERFRARMVQDGFKMDDVVFTETTETSS